MQAKETWMLLDTGYHDAATNMAIDEWLLHEHSNGNIKPTLRFYGWERPSLTVGHFQNVERTIDFSGVKRHNCDFVRRLTGGSAVLHADELTYSIIVKESHPKIPKSINKAYYVLAKGLLKGYNKLNVAADFALSEREMLRQRSAVCFEVPAMYEIVVDGKKVSGNAQTRKSGVLLQHGSVPMSFDSKMLFDLFYFSKDSFRERQRQSFVNKATSLNEIKGEEHTFDQLKDAFLAGFKLSLDINLEPFSLSAKDWTEIHQLADEKYRTDEWNFRL